MLDTTKRTIATLTAAACLGGAGWAIASSSNGSSGSSVSTESAAATDTAIAANATAYGAPPQQREVTGDAAEKITAAVLAKVPGATIERIEQDAQGYHAHITKSDGTRATVRVNAQFAVTAVEAGRGPGGPGQGGGPGGPCPEDGAQGGGGGGSSGESPAPAAAAGESGTSET
jgi:hypothetical protein